MRVFEIFILAAAIIALVTVLGSGAIDHYVADFQNGLSVINTLVKNGTATAALLLSLATGIAALTNSAKWRKKRKR